MFISIRRDFVDCRMWRMWKLLMKTIQNSNKTVNSHIVHYKIGYYYLLVMKLIIDYRAKSLRNQSLYEKENI